MEKKIRTIEQSRFMSDNNMNETHGGASCENPAVIYKSCSTSSDFYSSCNSSIYETCAPSVSYRVIACALHLICGDIGNGIYMSCSSENSKSTCSGQHLCGSPIY